MGNPLKSFTFRCESEPMQLRRLDVTVKDGEPAVPIHFDPPLEVNMQDGEQILVRTVGENLLLTFPDGQQVPVKVNHADV